jgi:hypothetical protein
MVRPCIKDGMASLNRERGLYGFEKGGTMFRQMARWLEPCVARIESFGVLIGGTLLGLYQIGSCSRRGALSLELW